MSSFHEGACASFLEAQALSASRRGPPVGRVDSDGRTAADSDGRTRTVANSDVLTRMAGSDVRARTGGHTHTHTISLPALPPSLTPLPPSLPPSLSITTSMAGTESSIHWKGRWDWIGGQTLPVGYPATTMCATPRIEPWNDTGCGTSDSAFAVERGGGRVCAGPWKDADTRGDCKTRSRFLETNE